MEEFSSEYLILSYNLVQTAEFQLESIPKTLQWK